MKEKPYWQKQGEEFSESQQRAYDCGVIDGTELERQRSKVLQEQEEMGK